MIVSSCQFLFKGGARTTHCKLLHRCCCRFSVHYGSPIADILSEHWRKEITFKQDLRAGALGNPDFTFVDEADMRELVVGEGKVKLQASVFLVGLV